MKSLFLLLSCITLFTTGCGDLTPEEQKEREQAERKSSLIAVRKQLHEVNNCREYCEAPALYLKRIPPNQKEFEVLKSNLRTKYWSCRESCQTNGRTAPKIENYPHDLYLSVNPGDSLQNDWEPITDSWN